MLLLLVRPSEAAAGSSGIGEHITFHALLDQSPRFSGVLRPPAIAIGRLTEVRSINAILVRKEIGLVVSGSIVVEGLFV